MKDDVIEAIARGVEKALGDRDTANMVYCAIRNDMPIPVAALDAIARAILPIAMNHAAGIAIAEAHRNRKNAEQYPATEDGGDGSREQCLVAAIACFNVVAAIRAAGEPK